MSWQVGNSQARFKESQQGVNENSARLHVVTVDQWTSGAGGEATEEAGAAQ
jgi:hypothetical protein